MIEEVSLSFFIGVNAQDINSFLERTIIYRCIGFYLYYSQLDF